MARIRTKEEVPEDDDKDSAKDDQNYRALGRQATLIMVFE